MNSIDILLIEDSPGDVELTRESFASGKLKNSLYVIMDGESALDYLFQRGPYQDHALPDIILLDLNLPVLNGYQVLERMKANPETRCIPVVVLTTTDNRREVRKCYELGANIYITKPVDYKDFTEAIRKMGLFLSIVQVPHGA